MNTHPIAKAATIVALTIGLAFPLSAEGVSFKEAESFEDWESVLGKAKNEGRLVYISLTAEWCGYCAKMKEKVYPNQRVADYFNANFLNRAVGADSELGDEIAYAYQLEGVPAHLFFDGEGALVYMLEGYLSVSDLLSFGQDAEKEFRAYLQYQEAFEKRALPQDEYEAYAETLYRRDEFEKAALAAEIYFSTFADKDAPSDRDWRVVATYGLKSDSEVFRWVVAKQADLGERFGPEEIASYFEDAYLYNAMIAEAENDKEYLKTALIQTVIPHYVETSVSEGQDREEYRSALEALAWTEFYSATQDWEAYRYTADSYLRKHVWGSYEEVFGQAGVAFVEAGDQETAQVAIEWAARAVELQPGFDAYYVQAGLLAVAGYKDKAVKQAALAVDSAPDEESKLAAEELKAEIEQL